MILVAALFTGVSQLLMMSIGGRMLSVLGDMNIIIFTYCDSGIRLSVLSMDASGYPYTQSDDYS